MPSSTGGLQGAALTYVPQRRIFERSTTSRLRRCFFFAYSFPPPRSSCLDSTLASAATSFPSSPSAAIPARREIGRPFGAVRPRSAAVDTAYRTVQRLLLACGPLHDTGIGDVLEYRTKAPPQDLCPRDLNHHLQALLTARVAWSEFPSDRASSAVELQVRCCRYPLYLSPSKESS